MQRDSFGTTLFNATLPHRGAGDSGETARVPRLSMRDTGESIELTAELPGIKPENVSVELEGDVLTIRGEAEEHEERGDERMEHRAWFYRQLALPEGVDPEQVHAAYENGRLTIQLPKRADRSNARHIPITTQQQGQPGGEPARQTKEKAA
jgi:HSP20 family protein